MPSAPGERGQGAGAGRQCPRTCPSRPGPQRHESPLDPTAAQCERGKPQVRPSSGVLLSKNRGVLLHGPGGGGDRKGCCPLPALRGTGWTEAPRYVALFFHLSLPPTLHWLSGRPCPSLLALDERRKKTVPVWVLSRSLTCIMRTRCFSSYFPRGREGMGPLAEGPAPSLGESERRGDAKPGRLPTQHSVLAFPDTKPLGGGGDSMVP